MVETDKLYYLKVTKIQITFSFSSCALTYCRAVGRSENPGEPALFGGHNLPLLVDIGLTNLPKSGTPRDDRL